MHDLTGQRLDESVALKLHYAPGVLPRLVTRVAAAVRRAPRDASVTPSATGLTVTPARGGRALDAPALRQRLASALLFTSRPADIATTTQVRRAEGLDRAAGSQGRRLHHRRPPRPRPALLDHLKPARTFPIAVGRQGLETPQGLYDVQWKQTNPSWYVPNSAWAGKLAGKVIPPGPDDPIKARWMAFNGGAGIHGIDPSEYGSIGHDASHGCVRMRIPDVISLYAHTPVGTPVYVA